jgi:hypothetical protein
MIISNLIESEIIMSSIRSTLIRSCFANIQRELIQLEDWLNRDLTTVPEATTKSGTDSSIIYQAIQQLSKQLDSQQHTLHHIIDRIDVLEETRNIHIQEKDENNLWLDTEGVQLQNEIVDHEYESIVNVNKTEEVLAIMPNPVETESVAAPVAAPVAESVVASVATPVAESVVASVAASVSESVVASVVTDSTVDHVVEPVLEEPATNDSVEEEDGLEEVEYNGTTYYRDSNLVMYQLDDDGELTDAVGVWREKTQSIKFYKK